MNLTIVDAREYQEPRYSLGNSTPELVSVEYTVDFVVEGGAVMTVLGEAFQGPRKKLGPQQKEVLDILEEGIERNVPGVMLGEFMGVSEVSTQHTQTGQEVLGSTTLVYHHVPDEVASSPPEPHPSSGEDPAAEVIGKCD